MTQDTLLYVMTAAVAVSAIAIVIQLLILLDVHRRVKPAVEQVTRLAPKVESLVETTQRSVQESRAQIQEITVKVNTVLDSAKQQLARIDEVMADATARAKIQLDRVDMVLDDTVSRVHETVTILHNGVMRPMREVAAVASGIRAALQYFMRGGRPSVAQATSDEEMFI